MGCCYSNEAEDDHVVAEPPRRVPATRRPTPTTTSSQGYYDYFSDTYYNQQQRDYRAVPTVPTPTFQSVPVCTYVAKQNVRPVVIKPTQEFKTRPGALYGEYKCHCGYSWVSRLSWRDKYQQCRRCKAFVRPKNQRELRPTDFTPGAKEIGLEHPEELCEMCKQVGGHCGKYK